jgi:hypothetical protein
MQQYTVPQFIDVESKIIGPITVRQFMIFLAGAIIAGLSYRLFDFSLFLTIAIIIFIIAVTFAFIKVNSQSFHLFLLNAIQTLRRPRTRVWNNRLNIMESSAPAPTITPVVSAAPQKLYKESRLAELSLIVDTKGRYKGE